MQSKLAFNPSTETVYSPKNTSILEDTPFDNPEWAGFRQWLSLGRAVKKGEKGTQIFMVCTKKVENRKGEIKEKEVVKRINVFNREQTKEI